LDSTIDAQQCKTRDNKHKRYGSTIV